jgi:UDP-glucose 4-epimerase
MYLVTGGGGFVGSHIVRRLVALGENIRVLDNFSSGKPENLRGLEDRVEIFFGDLCDQPVVKRAMEGVDVVLHQAALRSAPLSVQNPALLTRVNVEGTVNVLVAARDIGVKKVIYASSSSVYGNRPVMPKKEQEPPGPVSPYAVSKLTGEYYCKVFADLYGLETISLRYFKVYGPGEDPSSPYAGVIPRFIDQALRGTALEIHGDGWQSRDFAYIDDVVNANLLAVHSQEGKGETFNVGQGVAYSLLEVVDFLQDILGRELPLLRTKERPGDVRRTLADVSEAKRCLGYRPQVSFAEGLERTVEDLAKRMEIGLYPIFQPIICSA